MDVTVKTMFYVLQSFEEIEANHVQLLYHSEVRRLSRGLILKNIDCFDCSLYLESWARGQKG